MSLSVLVVDDDPAFRDLAGDVLAAAGLTVVGQADSVATGLAAAIELTPDVALIDIDLPDGDGITLARALSELPVRPRVLLTSVDGGAAGPEEVQKAGAIAFVHKSDLTGRQLRKLFAAD
jgi:DNA-binding NarL/FixJ family response regulator